jgi:hypothetical protein
MQTGNLGALRHPAHRALRVCGDDARPRAFAGTRRNPDPFGDSDDDDDWDPNARPHQSRRCHLAEFFDDVDAQGDRLDTDKPSPYDFFEEPPSDSDL